MGEGSGGADPGAWSSERSYEAAFLRSSEQAMAGPQDIRAIRKRHSVASTGCGAQPAQSCDPVAPRSLASRPLGTTPPHFLRQITLPTLGDLSPQGCPDPREVTISWQVCRGALVND